MSNNYSKQLLKFESSIINNIHFIILLCNDDILNVRVE